MKLRIALLTTVLLLFTYLSLEVIKADRELVEAKINYLRERKNIITLRQLGLPLTIYDRANLILAIGPLLRAQESFYGKLAIRVFPYHRDL